MKKMAIILFFLTLVTDAVKAEGILSSSELKFLQTQTDANNTFIFWVNGDSDRFRPEKDIDSKVVRLDTLDVNRIRKLSKNCSCNTVIIHDQRGQDKWYTNGKHFGAFIYVYSNGKLVKSFGEKNFQQRVKINRGLGKISYSRRNQHFNELNQSDPQFLTAILQLTQKIFPHTQYHLVYRGHSFANSLTREVAPFDYSHPKDTYHLEKFSRGLDRANIKLETITFAACSMSNISFAREVAKHAQFMIASQVNINETGETGFSFSFLKDVSNKTQTSEMAHIIGKKLLERFKKVNKRELYIRETPSTVIDLNALSKALKGSSLRKLRKKMESGPAQFRESKVAVTASPRYVEKRKKEGISVTTLKMIAKHLRVESQNLDYDLIQALRKIKAFTLAKSIENSIKQYGKGTFSPKTGLSIDLTY